MINPFVNPNDLEALNSLSCENFIGDKLQIYKKLSSHAFASLFLPQQMRAQESVLCSIQWESTLCWLLQVLYKLYTSAVSLANQLDTIGFELLGSCFCILTTG